MQLLIIHQPSGNRRRGDGACMPEDITERKRAEEKLQKSERLLRAFMSAIVESAFVVDTEGVVVIANETLARRMGTNVNELIGTCIYNYLPAEIARERKTQVDNVVRTGNLVRYEDVREGLWIDSYAYPIFGEEGRVVYIGIIAVDITERKRAEETIRRTTNTLQSLIQALPLATIALDRGGNLTLWNPSAERTFGWGESEVLGKPLMIVPEDEQNKYQALLGDGWKGSAVVGLEVKRQRKDGSLIDVRLSSALLDDGKGQITGVIGLLEDITERKRVDERLRESEEKYRLLVENANEAIIVAQDGYIRFFNPKASQLAGLSGDKLPFLPFSDFIHPEDQEMVSERHFRRLQGEEPPEIYSFRILDREGNTKWVEINSVLIDWKGKPATLNFLNDITERKRAEEEVWRYNKELTALNAIAIMVNSSLDLQQILDQTLDKVLEITKMEIISLYLTDPQTEELVLSTYRGVSKEFADQVRTFKLGESIVGLAAQSGKPIVADDLTGDPRVTATLVSGEGMRSLAAIPMKLKNKIQGMINIASYTWTHSLTRKLASTLPSLTRSE